MTYKDFVLTFYNVIDGSFVIPNGHFLADKSSGYTDGEDEIDINFLSKTDISSIYKSIPQ